MRDVHVRVPEGLWQRFGRVVAGRHQRPAEALREAVREWCDRHEPQNVTGMEQEAPA